MNTEQTTRLFFALWPEPATRERLTAVQHAIPDRSGRYGHPLDLHMTLVFLGAVEAQRMACVFAAAQSVSLSPFSLSIDRVETWKRPRILCCGPTRTPPPLTRLVADLENALAECGFAPEKRPYRPHVTLARKVQSAEDVRLHRPLQWPVEGFVLAGPGGQRPGPRYRILKKWPADS